MIDISATNRGATRIDSDFYATPESVIHNFFTHYGVPSGPILEPSAGNGNFIKVLRELDCESHITSVEIREEELDNLKRYSEEVIINDFLDHTFVYDRFNYIIGNPPFSKAMEFIEKCFEISDMESTTIIMLLRTAFLESKKRYDFWQKHPLNGLYTLSQRPSFTNGGTDSCSYSFFVWDGTDKQTIKII